MFHLSRRLNGTDLRENNNLEQILLEDTSISKFFKKHNVTFEKGEGHINMFYKGELQPLDNEFKYDGGNIYYVRSRLGYNTAQDLSLIHISEPTRLGMISYAVFCLKKKKTKEHMRG